METPSVSFTALTPEMVVTGFDCGDAELNNFLLHDAIAHQTQCLATTALAVCDGKIVGYVSLLCDSVKLDSSEKTVFIDAKRYAEYPAIKIGRMAVDKTSQGLGIGRKLLEYAHAIARKENQNTGCRFLTVDAYPAAENFYHAYGFTNNLTKNKPGRRTTSKRYDLLNPKPS